ncbi:MAG: carboxypeptidase-like regulatory domain-containing protein, partial [Planctomycetota bacterium]
DGTVFITATNEGSTSVAQVNVSFGDALTTVVGVVTLEDGTLVQGADVTVSGLGLSTTTDAAGTFSIASVPTLLGDLDVFVSAPVLAETFIGSSTDLSPEAGLATDSGVIVIRSPCDPKPPGGPSPAHGGLDVALDAQLSWSETQELGTGKTWLVVGSVSSNMSQAATALGATIQTTVDFDNVLLDDIDVVAFTLGSSGSFTAGPTTLTKLTNFVSAGGGLYVELAGGTGDNWSWVPTPGLTSFNSNYDDISIVDPLSPIVTAISDPQLDGWGQSAHSEFLEVGLTNVVLTRTSSGNEVLLTTSLGSGPICYSNLHMADHSQGAPVLQNTMGFLEIPACDPRVYDVYLDVVNPPTTLVCADVTETSCDPGGLLPGVTYFWQVVAKSGLDTTPSAVWTFSTVDS